MKKAMIFNELEQYERWTEQFEDCSEYADIPVAIDDGRKVALDMFTECKSWKTALGRFEKAFSGINSEIAGWVECMRESAENGCFEDVTGCRPEWTSDPEEIKEFRKRGAYSYGIEEQYDGCWYVYLNISGLYAGRDVASEC